MTWRRLGRVFQATGQRPWMQSHTAMPMPLHLEGDRYRVYFGTRDADQRPRVGWLELDLSAPGQPLAISEEPALGPGAPGQFDDNGVYPGPLERAGDRLRMLYSGRTNHEPPRYTMAIGCAESVDGGAHFERLAARPLLEQGEHDPWMVTTPWVLREPERALLYYTSGLGWDSLDPARPVSRYHIKLAQLEGEGWCRAGRVAIELAPGETNVAAPTVATWEGGYRMLYSVASGGGAYRLGYAESEDGLEWVRRDDEVGIAPTVAGWERSLAYPALFVHEGALYLLYSGEGNGRGGIGIAVWEA